MLRVPAEMLLQLDRNMQQNTQNIYSYNPNSPRLLFPLYALP
jgi:hypothetical protein